MRTIINKFSVSFLFALCIFLSGCDKNELEDIEANVPPKVYIGGITDGTITLKSTNKSVQIDKVAKTITAAIGINRSGLQNKDGFSVKIAMTNTGLPAGVVPVSSSDYMITSSAGSGAAATSSIQVPEGESTGTVYLKFSKSLIDANSGKQIGFKISISDASKYEINPDLSSATVIIDVPTFQETQTDITETYIKNSGSPFLRVDDGHWNRWGILEDWLVTASVKNMEGGTKGGFDNNWNGNNGFMSMERWEDPEVPNGKIYQTMNLPKGRYELVGEFDWAGLNDPGYIVVAEGTSLPDATSINSTNTLVNADLRDKSTVEQLPFVLTSDKQVTIGVSANLINKYQGFRLKYFKLYSFSSPFD
ncbi:MAG: DUF5013 domain-containing protein [Sphingobacteriaceae bacterium]|nr:DUF5013 domain-containing protein [Sphingobacteriaceae bacterium]